MTCGWYSKGYDVPMLNSRLVMWGQEPMKSLLHLGQTELESLA